ncbi:PADRE domain [Dillenia turbinata]|uniref:PADRE domain n=1 Tax=Dillenia turbinata TaxID=194707 RepID=A0AAN8UPF0_9MAGN
MGNCQAIDAATLVIQHPSGKIDNFYWPISASEVMKMNPGHYVALFISTTPLTPSSGIDDHKSSSNVRFSTRVKLLRPTDTLVLGQVYRLITTQDVMRSLSAKKHSRTKSKTDSAEKHHSLGYEALERKSLLENNKQACLTHSNLSEALFNLFSISNTHFWSSDASGVEP